MKLLIVMKLSGNALKNHIQPLSTLNTVDEILIIRDSPGPEIPKTKYFYVPKNFRFFPLKIIYKLYLAIKLAIKEKPDRILAFHLYPHGILAFLSAKLTGRPVLVSLIAGQIETRLLREMYSVPGTERFFIWLLRNCDKLTVTGLLTRDFLIKKGVEAERIYVLSHAVDDEKFRPTQMEKKYDVVSISRLTPVKNIDTLIKAVAKVKDVKKDIRVCIVGSGSSEDSLKELCYNLGLDDNIDFVGFRKNTEEYYNSSKIFVLTSKREGFPFTIVEAMMCGIPSITSNAGDVLDVAKDGFNSIIIEDCYDDVAFSDAILRLLGDKTLYETLARNTLKIRETNNANSVSKKWEMILG